MKTMVALLLMTTVAGAQFKAQQPSESNFLAMECMVAKVTLGKSFRSMLFIPL
jgi:hypothetical protein